MEPLEIEDFSGGITDYPLNAPPNKMRVCDNLLLNQYQGQAKPFTRPGCNFYFSNAKQIITADRISTMFYFRKFPFVQASEQLRVYNGANWQSISSVSSLNPFYDFADTTSVFTYSEWNGHMLIAHDGQVQYNYYQRPMKLWLDQTSTWRIASAGLPVPSKTGFSVSGAAGAQNFIYTVVFRYTYQTKDNVTFVDRSAPMEVYSANNLTSGTKTVTIPAYVQEPGEHYDLTSSNFKKEIYRTTDGGTVFYYVGEVGNATTSFNDTVSDAVLVDNEPLYTEDGRVENGQPPRCKLVHVMGDIAYYANIMIPGGAQYQQLSYRVQQSIPGDIDSCPGDFYLEVDDTIVGMSSTKSNLVLLGSRSIFRVDGVIDELGRGEMVAEKISDTANCISAQSVVQTLDGVFWAGLDGIYYTDGFRVLKLNKDYDETYYQFVSEGGVDKPLKQSRIQGKYDKVHNRIWWTVQHESPVDTDDVDKCYILDLNFGIKENATFTTASGLDSFRPTAIDFTNGDLIRCDKRGYIFRHSDTARADLKIDANILSATPTYQTIFYDLESIAYNFGTSFTRKFVPSMNLTAESSTNLSLEVTSINDDGKRRATLAPVRYRGTLVWGDLDIYWGDPAYTWDSAGLIAEKRRFPANNLRCLYKSVKFTNAKVVVINSDLVGNCAIDSSLKTATLSGASEWPTYAIDYYISFEYDNFVSEFLVTSRSASTLVFSDGSNLVPGSASSRWVIRGYPKGEILNLLNFAIHGHMFGTTQDVFNKADTGEPS